MFSFRLLDKRIEHVTTGVQSALDGATVADKKCASLGFELVKVFRMFANRKDGQGIQENCHVERECKENKTSQLPIKEKHINEQQDVDFHSQSTIDGMIDCLQNTSKGFENHHSLPARTNTSPQKIIKRGMSGLIIRDILRTKATHPSQIQKPNLLHEREQDSGGFCNFEGEKPSKIKTNSLQDSPIGANECKLHGPLSVDDECKSILDTNLDGQLTIEKHQEGSVKNYQRTNICLEAGRIHVNVSHRSNGLNRISEKRNDLIAVQS
jgi:hypothetical protein